MVSEGGMGPVTGAPEDMNLRNRHFLKLLDFGPLELENVARSALTLKKLHHCRQRGQALHGRNVALLFERPKRESRWTVQAAVAAQGAFAHYFGPGETGLGEQEQVGCAARQLGRLYDALVVQGLEQEVVEEVARLAGVPVCNLASVEFQPLPMLADLATMMDRSHRPLSELSLVLLGDGRTSAAQSMLVAAAKFGLDLRVCGPEAMQPEETLLETCLALAAEAGGQIRLFTETEQAMKGADFVYWQSWDWIGAEGWESRLETLLPYRATGELLSQSGHGSCGVLGHLPVSGQGDGEVSRLVAERFGIEGVEMSRDVFDSPENLAFEQAENFLHCCEAVLVALLA